MLAWIKGHRKERTLAPDYHYTLAQDPYLDIAYNAISCLIGLITLVVLDIFFQWPNFLILIIVALMLIFMSDFPQNQTRPQKCITATVISFWIWISFNGVFFTMGSRWILLSWIFAYTLLSYLLSLRDNNRRLHLSLGVVFSPIFIHIMYDHTLGIPINSWVLYQDYSIGLVICYSVAIALSLLLPRRNKAKCIIACIELLCAIRRALLQIEKASYRQEIYVVFRHIYFLRQQELVLAKKKLNEQECALIFKYLDLCHNIIMTLTYLKNNEGISQKEAEVYAELIGSLLSHNVVNKGDRSPILEECELNEAARKHLYSYFMQLADLYSQVIQLRKKYV
ncbi:hypothetical protein [Fangia hongkongensis]|uniref:hypothetical protein n=1 Tax=Fangia hongkongensis TaxID=270495 RepID=UPI00036A4445|nr:hypothetical protein [Fangia hongkongensis]MBK2124079.1 hypothetical protein [Fangia hongkongensis]